MGGQTFAHASAAGEPTLKVVRLDSAEYSRLKSILAPLLRTQLGEKLDTLIEAPEKTDYGDIDFLVAYDGRPDWTQLANHVGAAGVIRHHPGMCSLAFRKDGTGSEKPAVIYKHVNDTNPKKASPSPTVTEEEYAQVDIEAVPTALFDLRTFYGSYGDMAALIGHMLRNIGFTVSDKGLWLRMIELDQAKAAQAHNIADKDGLLFLSHDPKRICDFIGIDYDRWSDGFGTLDELYSWLAHSRLLSRSSVQIDRNDSRQRDKEAKRTVYTTFFHEWLPAHFDKADSIDKDEDEPVEVRKRIAQETVTFFGKQSEYETVRTALVRSVGNATAAQLLKPIAKLHCGREDKQVTEIVRGIRRFSGVTEDGTLHVLEHPHTDVDSELYRLLAGPSLRDEGLVSEYVKDHWEELRALERRRVKAAQEARREQPSS